MNIRAFDLTSVVTGVDGLVGYVGCSLSCLEFSGNNLFIGTTNGLLLRFSISEFVDVDGKTTNNAEEWARGSLPSKRPVTSIQCASALNRVVALSDEWLFLLNMDLENIGNPRMKWVTCFAVNLNPTTDNPFAIQLALGTKKKQVLLCEIGNNDKFSVLKEIVCSDIPLTLGLDGGCLCYATELCYHLYDVQTDERRDLFPYNIAETKAVIKRISREEFLLTAPSMLGMFVSSEGASKRPPLNFGSYPVHALAHSHPYILALGDEFITVHNTLDQQTKQHLPFVNGRIMNDFEGQVFLASEQDVYKLTAISWDKQVQALLASNHVTEALQLARDAHKIGLPKEDFLKIFRRLQCQAGFIELQNHHWSEATELFAQGRVDIREVICLYPDLMPLPTEFVRETQSLGGALHTIPDIRHVIRSDSELEKLANQFLFDLLQLVWAEPWAVKWKKEAATTLIKLATMLEPGQLSDLVPEWLDFADGANCRTWMEHSGRIGALASLYYMMGNAKTAINLWSKLLSGEIADQKTFVGIDSVIGSLQNCDDVEVVSEFITSMIRQGCYDDALRLIRAHKSPLRLNVDRLLSLFESNPSAYHQLIEFFVLDMNSDAAKFHSHLLESYMSHLHLLQPSQTEESSTSSHAIQSRSKLQLFLKKSSHYRPRHILAQIGSRKDLAPERIILHSKLNEHEAALRIYVCELTDYEGAEDYCRDQCLNQPWSFCNRLYCSLLRLYRDSQSAGASDEALVGPTLRLLNSPDLEIDPAEVFNLIPEHWSLNMLTIFLRQSVQKFTSHRNQAALHNGLNQAVLFDLKCRKYGICSHPVTVGERSYCPVCEKPFVEAKCFVYPNGTVTHVDCVRHPEICPVTSEVFRVSVDSGPTLS